MQVIFTEEEQRLPMMEWDDAALGRVVKGCFVVFSEKSEGVIEDDEQVRIRAAALMLVGYTAKIGAKHGRIELTGVTNRGQGAGDWVVEVLKKVEAPR